MKKKVFDVWLLEGALVFTDAVKFDKESVSSDELKYYFPYRITIETRRARR